MKKIIEVKNLTKKYGNNVLAVKGIDFDVYEGEFFAFLGPNGAGKSTVINILSTILSSSGGDVLIDNYHMGENDNKIQEIIGIVFQHGVLDNVLTVQENLETRASFYNFTKDQIKTNVNKTIELMDLDTIRNRRYGTLSGGQKRRVDIARAIINTPKILFLDEPTTGLDPQTRSLVWKVINKLQKENKMTIFLTTHYMEETELADRVAIIDNGKIAVVDTPHNLKEKYSSDILKLYYKDKKTLKEYLDKHSIEYKTRTDYFELMAKDSIGYLDLLGKIKDNLNDFEYIKGNMDSVFVSVTGKTIREDK